jgi:hypothetical protein
MTNKSDVAFGYHHFNDVDIDQHVGDPEESK